MGLGDPDPSTFKSAFDKCDDIASWFKQDKQMTGDKGIRVYNTHEV